MKKVILIVTAVVSTIAMQSCRQKNTQVVESGSAIEIRADVAGVVSKASKTSFAVNDTLGMWVVPYIKAGTPSVLYPVDNYADNVLYKHDGVNFKTTTLVVYPSPEAEVDLYAVAPYQRMMSAQSGNTMTDPKAYPWSVKKNQTTAESVVLSDIMTSFYKGAKQGSIPELQFKHRLSQVLIKLKVPATYNKLNVASVKKVELTGLRLNSTVSIVDTAAVPVVVVSDATNPKSDIETFCSVKPMPAGTIAGDYVYEGIVVPQSVASGDYIVRVTLDVTGLGDVVFDCKTSAAYKYEPKMSTTIDVNIEGQTEILLGRDKVGITGWQKATDVAGSTIKLCKMIFNVLNVGGANLNVDKAQSATLVISDSTYAGKVTYDNANSQYVIEYDPRLNLGGRLNKITITDGDAITPATIVPLQTLAAPGYAIKGDPTSSVYSSVMGTIVFEGNAVTVFNGIVNEIVDQSGANANSHVVKPGQILKFNAKAKGNSAAVLATAAVRIVWQTAEKGANSNGENLTIGYNGNVVYDAVSGKVAIAANKAGNAVVAAYDVSNNILWSWHIWVSPVALADMPKTIYNTATFQNANGAGKSILDRNLGATSVASADGYVQTGGMLYQWGRKDPFAGAANASITGAVRVYNHLGVQVNYELVKNSVDNSSSLDNMKLFYSITNVGDWTSAKNNSLWTSSSAAINLPSSDKGVKPLADPCPAGYRVATGGTNGNGTWGALGVNDSQLTGWTGTSTVAAGYTFDNAVLAGAPWYSANGYRQYDGFKAVGVKGALWSASASANSGAMGFLYEQGHVSPSFEINRSTACAVRCVEE